LVKMNADVIIPLPTKDLSGKQLRIMGSARDSSVFTAIVDKFGIWEEDITLLLSKILKPGDTFMDIGANLGYYTLLGSSLVGSSGQVISFEPMPQNYANCKNNIYLNELSNVTLFNYGLWNELKSMDISVPSELLGNARIVTNSETGYDKDEVKAVKCAPLDLLVETGELNINKLNIIKMDIEGSEPFALDGMRNTLQNFKPIMILELNRHNLRRFYNRDSKDYWDFFNEMGYKIHLIKDADSFEEMVSAEQLNRVCPPNSLVDLIAFPV
jgi:FkbM family methyltransferase